MKYKRESINRRDFFAILVLGMGLIQMSFTGCAMGPKWEFHAIRFNQGYSKSFEKVEILEWDYGVKDPNYEGKGQIGRRNKYQIGDSRLSGGTAGPMPVGDFLYVKWYDKQSGEVREDRVDLKSRLPNNIDHYEIFFYVAEQQLYVFLFPPRRYADTAWGDVYLHIGATHPMVTPGHTILDMPGVEKYLIYPEKISH